MLDTARPYGVSKAMAEVLVRTREHLEANECAEVARHVRLLLERSGLAAQEFASRIGVPADGLRRLPRRPHQPVGVADDPHAPVVGPVREDGAPEQQAAD